MLFFSGILLLSSIVRASPTPRPMAVQEQLESVPAGFLKEGPADLNAMIDFHVALAPKDIAGLEKTLYAVSTPGSSSYGQYLSLDQVKTFTSPTAETVSAVTEWLNQNGITEIKSSGPFDDKLTFSTSVSKANQLLNANFETFVHESGSKRTRTLAYSIPTDLFQHIQLIHPTTSFAPPLISRPHLISAPISSASNHFKRADPAPSSCSTIVTPSCLQSLYGIPATLATQSSNRLGVSGFDDQFAQTADLTAFLTQFRPDLPSSTTFTLQTLDDGENLQGQNVSGIEADLDTQFTIGVASGVPTTFFSVGLNNTDGLDGFGDLIDYLNAETAPPQVLTTSYGLNENQVTAAAATKLCNDYMALGARGVSILFASGDGGVSGGHPENCTTFVPTFPSGCPYITIVGSTNGVNEVASNFTTGGFSNLFARPSFQDTVVTNYLNALGSTNAGLFNTSGRAFPDVAAQGENVEIIVGGISGLIGGTSCSSPIFSSVISLVNDRLIAAGKPVLGFLNPFIYSNPQAFFDIISGNNPGCGTDGFPATTGWDPVTGMGTPNFTAIMAAAGL